MRYTEIDLTTKNPLLFRYTCSKAEAGTKYKYLGTDELPKALANKLLEVAKVFNEDKVSGLLTVSFDEEGGFKNLYAPSVYSNADRDGLVVRFGNIRIGVSSEELKSGTLEGKEVDVELDEDYVGKYKTSLLRMMVTVAEDETYVLVFPLRKTDYKAQLDMKILRTQAKKGKTEWIQELEVIKESNSNGGNSSPIEDIRKLEDGAILKVLAAKPINTSFGKNYILTAQADEGESTSYWSHKNLNPLLEALPVFPFTVKIVKTLWKTDGDKNLYSTKFEPLEVDFLTEDTDDDSDFTNIPF